MSTATESYAELIAAIESGDQAWIDTELAIVESARESEEYWGSQPKPQPWHFPMPTGRDAIEVAAAEPPADHVRAIPVRTLVAEAPALPPIKMPKLSERTLNGKAVTRCVEAGEKAGIVHTPQGVRVVPDLDTLDDDPSVVVIAQQPELRYLLLVDGKEPLDAARFIIDRESRVLAQAAA